MAATGNTFETDPPDCPEADCTLALAALHGDTVFASGSAVLAGPHVALTARHVTDDFTRKFQGSGDLRPDTTDFQILARARIRGQWWMFHVRRIHLVEDSDVTALYLSLAPDQPAGFEWPRVTLDLFPPRRRRRVWSWGHVSSKAFFADVKAGAIHWYAAPRRSSGLVQDIFPLRRDSSVVNFPAFQFDARVDGSMSGGPIFNELGHVVGLNSTSMAATAEHPVHASTGALLWPALGLPFTHLGETFGAQDNITCLEDLQRLGYLDTAHHCFVDVGRSGPANSFAVDIRLPRGRL
jgi:hypothetical protein